MPRLPIPGNDEGTWGTLLNDFLRVEHDSNGSLKLRSDGTLDSYAPVANTVDRTTNQTIAGVKTFTSSPVVPTPATPAQAATKAYVDSVAGSGAPSATTSSLGIVQLAGDLGGPGTTATAPIISNGAITTAKLASGAVTDASISSISQSKITNLTTDLSNKQPLDSDLTNIAALVPANDTIMQRKADAWTAQTPAQVKIDFALTKADVDLSNVDNTSDASKPVSAATQTALNLKANTATTITAGTGLTGGGDLSASRTLTVSYGATAGTAAQGNDSRLSDARTPFVHAASHASGGTDVVTPGAIGAVAMVGSNIATVADSSIQFLRVNVPDDGSSTASWPDRLAFYFNNVRTGYHNEYGELRARPAKVNTVALRAMAFTGGSSGDIFQVTSADASTVRFGVSDTAITANVPIISPNLPRKITVSSTAPSSPADGDIWFDTSGV